MKREIRALLVGIETWQSEQLAAYPLEGCLNDVDLLQRTLTESFGARTEHLRVLRNSAATRAAILSGLHEMLLEPAQQWAAAGRPAPAPALIFHFSGHGSESLDPTGTQPNGRDQTIVPYDSRTPGVFDIKDWELSERLAEIARYNDNLTVMLDCCHSGTGTRSVERRPRTCPADLRRPPTGRPTTGTRSSPAAPALGHVLLAACAAHQAAFPYDDDSTGVRKTFGMFSYALGKTLTAPDAANLTYRDLHGRITRLLKSWGTSQSPQCEGDRDRRLFSEAQVARAAAWRILERTETGWMIDAGALHGLAAGDLLEATLPQPGPLAADREAAATRQLVVMRVAAACSEVQLAPQAATGSTDSSAASQTLQLETQMLEAQVRRAPGRRREQRTRVSLAHLVGATRTAAERLLGLERLAERVIVEDSPAAPLRLESSGPQWRLVDGDGRPLAAWDRDDEQTGVETLARHAWSRTVWGLRNPRRSPLEGRLQCAIRQVILGGGEKRRPGELLTAPIDAPAEGELRLPAGTPVCFEFRNDSERPLYLQAFFFGYDGTIVRIYPKAAGEQSAVAPGRSVFSSGFRLQFAVGESAASAEVREGVKVFASVNPCDLESLCATGGTRALLLDRPDDWTTIETSFLMTFAERK
ncbi:MAG: caspase family protein [Pirellulales bacterium]